MATTHDSSVLFSLGQLMDQYETSVREEEEALARKAAEEEKVKQEALLRAKEEEERRAREAAMQKAREEAARREEEARLEGLRLAALERVRREADLETRIELTKRADEHARALTALREDGKKKRLKRALWTSAFGAAALITGAFGVYFGKIKPDTEALISSQTAEINASSEETRRLQAQLDANQKRIAEAEARLIEAKNRTKAEVAVAPPEEEAPKKTTSWRPTATKTVEKKTTSGSACLPGEPGCSFDGTRLF